MAAGHFGPLTSDTQQALMMLKRQRQHKDDDEMMTAFPVALTSHDTLGSPRESPSECSMTHHTYTRVMHQAIIIKLPEPPQPHGGDGHQTRVFFLGTFLVFSTFLPIRYLLSMNIYDNRLKCVVH